MEFQPQTIRQWHPALLTAAWDGKPVRKVLLGNAIVLFRTASGKIAALQDACKHRNFPLSAGKVAGERLVCAYHGWEYACNGAIHCPSLPRLKAKTKGYDVQSAHGVIWIKDSECPDSLSALDFPGYHPLPPMRFACEAPVEFLIDNMSELEHTASVHGVFGFRIEDLADIGFEFQPHEDSVYIYYEGPQRPLSLLLRAATGLRDGDAFMQDAHVGFAPLRNEYDLRWQGPGGRNRDFQLKFVIYYNPNTPGASEMFVFLYTTFAPWGRLGFNRLVNEVLRRVVGHELRLDVAIIEKAKEYPEGPKSWMTTRLDRPLLEIRKRLAGFLGSEHHAEKRERFAREAEIVLPPQE